MLHYEWKLKSRINQMILIHHFLDKYSFFSRLSFPSVCVNIPLTCHDLRLCTIYNCEIILIKITHSVNSHCNLKLISRNIKYWHIAYLSFISYLLILHFISPYLYNNKNILKLSMKLYSLLSYLERNNGLIHISNS